MTYKEWLGILLPGSGSSSEGSSETSNEPLIVQMINEGYDDEERPIIKLNKTNKEIYDAFMSNKKVLLYKEQSVEGDDIIEGGIRKDTFSLIQISQLNQIYLFSFGLTMLSFQGENEDGYAINRGIK